MTPAPRRARPPAPGEHEWEPRFWAKVDKGVEFDDHWLWTGARDEDGYGRFRSADGSVRGSHAVSWELHHGRPVPEGHHVDHECRVRACCNPAHLKAITHAENVLIGRSFSAVNAKKTRCPRGHEYTPENTREHHGSRECVTCIRSRDRERRRASREDRELTLEERDFPT